MQDEQQHQEDKWDKRDKGLNRIYVALMILGTYAASLWAAVSIGKSWGSSEVILQLPERVTAMAEGFDHQFEVAKSREQTIVELQNKVNVDLARSVTDLRRDLDVNKTIDDGQAAAIQRLERVVDAIRDLMRDLVHSKQQP